MPPGERDLCADCFRIVRADEVNPKVLTANDGNGTVGHYRPVVDGWRRVQNLDEVRCSATFVTFNDSNVLSAVRPYKSSRIECARRHVKTNDGGGLRWRGCVTNNR